MKSDADGGFSSVILALAVVLYITIVCLTFAGLVATKPTVGIAFLEFVKEYGAIVAGIPVLIAVLVAKQQLDASNRQHVATLKRSFQKELDALNTAKSSLIVVLNLSAHEIIKKCTAGNILPSILSGNEAELIIDNLPKRIAEAILWCNEEINRSIVRYGLGQLDLSQFDERLQFIQIRAKLALGDVQAIYDERAKYWS
ncbi:hypothetical protein DKP76_07240 [Falsochrobactrum shanghaiense]|uniref:DUF4760 domain-containing protein n=1 Tax=Falsochrobactrum shanghaiense TaxID=2201899 RepID=A0A316JC47_9HYPH|nr:hypothetical protein [Falsochrobactrum shanghaiense]PWL18848.1 hypothetical protein DKP76_07240 [Falsochrobactrum shanghaiense]